MKLEGKVAIVTGGARGLGQDFSIALAKEGATVMVVGHSSSVDETVAQIKSIGGNAKGIMSDVSNDDGAKQIAEETVNSFGKIDILVNNAAFVRGLTKKPFWEIDPDEWDRVMSVNVKGIWLCTKAVFPYMKEQGYGKIVNLTSETFFTGSNGFVHYVASKGGIVGLTRALAVELGPYHITINAIAPGFTDSESARTLIDKMSDYDVNRTPLRRLEQPEDLLGALLFFSSKDSDFITGQTLIVDGGRVMH